MLAKDSKYFDWAAGALECDDCGLRLEPDDDLNNEEGLCPVCCNIDPIEYARRLDAARAIIAERGPLFKILEALYGPM